MCLWYKCKFISYLNFWCELDLWFFSGSCTWRVLSFEVGLGKMDSVIQPRANNSNDDPSWLMSKCTGGLLCGILHSFSVLLLMQGMLFAKSRLLRQNQLFYSYVLSSLFEFKIAAQNQECVCVCWYRHVV